MIRYQEKPVIRYRTKQVRDPFALAVVGAVCFVLGLILGYFL